MTHRPTPIYGIVLGSLIGLALFLAVLVVIAHAGQATVTYDDAAVQALAKQYRGPRLQASPGVAAPPTDQQVVQGLVDRALRPYIERAKREAACAKEKDTQVKAVLCPGVK